jgi:predicted ATPase/DNA-binding SARP family transcriptional activator
VGGAQSELQVDVLGPLRVTVDGAPVEIPGPKRRAVLVLLALAEGRTVAVDHLVDALWPDAEDAGRQALHTHVSRLRGHLGPAASRLQTRPDGYRLVADLDLARARALLAAARTNPDGAFARLREAHSLWRGPVLADLTDVAPVAVAVEGCAQLHRELTDALIAAALDAGRADDVAGLAAAAHADDPLREPAVLLLMRVLAATGQAADALRIGREYRRRLADETGLDPSPTLGELERDVAGAGAVAPVARTRPTTRLVGREQQVAALHRLLAAERLVTVVGPGGVGKTRVALEVAAQADTAAVVLLAPVADPAAVPHALAAALHLDVVSGDVVAACAALLGDRPGLLVADNCEHLLDAAREVVGTLLAACPRLSVLATSREPLGLSAEHTFRLTPLALPRPGQDPSLAAAVALFLDRARRVRPDAAPADLELVADVVRRLDGMPLAIELAAGRLSTFSLADLHRRLDRALDLLGGRPSGEARHRTLRATVEWSYQLLGDDERRLFRYLSVFVDGTALDAAEQLATELGLADDPGTALSRLVDASMLDAEFADSMVAGTGTRYRMLETLRAFGLDRLAAAGEDGDARARLLRWAVELTAWFATTAATEREPEADAALRREMANLRAAWTSARRHRAVDEAAAMITALYDAIGYRDLVELRDWAEDLAREFDTDSALAAHPRAAAVLGAAAEAAYHRGDYARSDRLARAGLARATADTSWYCTLPLAVAALARGAYTEVVERCLAAADRGVRVDETLIAAALATAYSGDVDRARELHARGRAHTVSPSMQAWSEYVAGEIESLAGRAEEAERHYRRAADLARGCGATFLTGVATVGLVALHGRTGRAADALRGYRDVVDYFARTGNWPHLWPALRNLADLLRRIGDPDPAAVIDAAADRAPDAPAHPGSRPPITSTAVASRADVLIIAREAIERNVARVGSRPAFRSG